MGKSIKKKIIKQTKLRKLNKYGTRKQRKHRTSRSGHRAFPSLFAVSTSLRRTKRVRIRTTNHKKSIRKGGRVLSGSAAEKIYYEVVKPIEININTLEKEKRDLDEFVRVKPLQMNDKMTSEYDIKQAELETTVKNQAQTIKGLFLNALNKVKNRIIEKKNDRAGIGQVLNLTTGIIDVFSTILWFRNKYNAIIKNYNHDVKLKLTLVGGGKEGGEENHSDYDTEPESDTDSDEREPDSGEGEFGSRIYSRLTNDDDNVTQPTDYDKLISEIQELINGTWSNLGIIKPRDPKEVFAPKTFFRSISGLAYGSAKKSQPFFGENSWFQKKKTL